MLKISKILPWSVLGCAVAACSQQRPLPPEVHLTHQHDQAYQQQVHRLQASAVNVSTTRLGQGDSSFTVLNLDVLNPQDQPGQPDTLRQRVRQLAHLVALDLANPSEYRAMNVRVVRKRWYSFNDAAGAQSFIYPVASLR